MSARTRSSVPASGIIACKPDPLVDDERIALDSARRSPAALRCAPGTSCCDRIASAAMRSVMLSAARYCASARRDVPCIAGRDQKVERGIVQRAAAGAGRIGAVGAAGLHPAIGLLERFVERAADDAAQTRAGAEIGVRIDIAADLARDVGLARHGEAPARQRPAPAARRQGSRPALRSGRRPWPAACQRGSAPTFFTSSLVASVCNACQRLNGSLSWAARRRRSSADRLAVSFTGAENSRLIDSTGRSGTFSNTKVSEGLVSAITSPCIGLPPIRKGRSAPSDADQA